MPKLNIAHLLLSLAEQGVQHRHAGRCAVEDCQSQQAGDATNELMRVWEGESSLLRQPTATVNATALLFSSQFMLGF